MIAHLSLILSTLVLAMFTGYHTIILDGNYQFDQTDLEKVKKLKQEFLHQFIPSSNLNLRGLYYTQDLMELMFPLTSFLPPNQGQQGHQGHNDQQLSTKTQQALYSSGRDCFKNINRTQLFDQFEKTWIWEEFRCGLRARLPINFFSQPPYMHPSLNSYPYLAYLTGRREYQSKTFLNENLRYMHTSELSHFQQFLKDSKNPELYLLSTLKSHELVAISNSENTLLTDQFLLLRVLFPASRGLYEYQIFPRAHLSDFLKNTDYQAEPFYREANCNFQDGMICWRYTPRKLFQLASNSGSLLFFGSIFVTTILVVMLLIRIKAQKKEEEQKRLALQVLTHEFRTPVTSMMINLEQLNRHQQYLPHETQEQLLRIASDVYRLQRLTEMSRNYLKTSHQNQLINFIPDNLPSIHEYLKDFFSDMGDNYQSLETQFLANDRPVKLDRYWFGISLKNLIDNAFNHGKPPVIFSFKEHHQSLVFEVMDQGECEFSKLDEMCHEFIKGSKSTGTGLGLNIVKKIIEEMGGELRFLPSPTRFQIILGEKIWKI